MKRNKLALVLFAVCSFSTPFAGADTGIHNPTTLSEEEPILDEADQALFDEESDISLRAVSCTTHKYNTAGCIRCTGSGEVRIVIDCKAPQVSDYKSAYAWFDGSTKICGECSFGINSVSYQAR